MLYPCRGLFNPACLKTKKKGKQDHRTRSALSCDAALVAHSAQDLQTLLNQFSSACSDFFFTTSLKKTSSPKPRNRYSTYNQNR